MAKVLVTGGTGFIGPRLVAELARRGQQVLCLVRRRRRLTPGVEAVVGDLADAASLRRALEGVEVVYHLAGATLARHPGDYRRFNALGTRRLGQACAERPTPPRLVYLSSLAAAGPAAPGSPRDEGDPPAPVSRYGQSKLAGELALRGLSGRLSASVVRAPSVFGPGDPNGFKLVMAARMGVLLVPARADVQLSWIYVDDLVEALILAAGRGRPLESTGSQGVYFVGLEQTTSLGEAAQLAAAIQGRPRVRIVRLPDRLCLVGGCVIDVWNSVTGVVRLLTRDKVREGVAGSWTCRVDRAREELGHTCRVDVKEGLIRSVAWYKEEGWI